MVTVHDTWERVFDGSAQADLEEAFPVFLRSSRWFGGKAKSIQSARISDSLRLHLGDTTMVLGFIRVAYAEGGTETYAVPMTAAFGPQAERIREQYGNSIITPLRFIDAQGLHKGLLYDAMWSADCVYDLLNCMGRHVEATGGSGALVSSATVHFDRLAVDPSTAPASVMKAEQSNTSVKFGERAIMKLYRRVEPGVNPELEIGRVLTARTFSHSPGLIGALEYSRENDEPITLALAQTYIANEGDAWSHTLRRLSRYFECISGLSTGPAAGMSPSNPSVSPPPDMALREQLSDFLHRADLLGRRTGELHRTLARPCSDPAFDPEAGTASYLHSRSTAMCRSARRALDLLRNRFQTLSEPDRRLAELVLSFERGILSRLGVLTTIPLSAMLIRCHGDYHLGQVLDTGTDYVIIDFEGEPAKPLAERRAKHLPIVDLAGMIRSFHYASHVALRQYRETHSIEPKVRGLETWAYQWYRSVRMAFLAGYRAVAGEAAFCPQSPDSFALLLNAHVLEKALYELTYELNNRPDWVAVPLSGILHTLDASAGSPDPKEAVSENDDYDPCSMR